MKLENLFTRNKPIDATPVIGAPNFAPPSEKLDKIKGSLPNARTSVTNDGFLTNFSFANEYNGLNFPKWIRDTIPVIRALMIINGDVGQAIWNIAALGNTGHKIVFDKNVDQAQVDKMRRHLAIKHKEWAVGSAGADGIITKMIYQLLIGGAISTEWVPSKDLSTIESVVFINPEEIYFKRNKRKTGYLPYQKVLNPLVIANKKETLGQYIPLNPATYKYYALNGDTDLPYGYPPYISVLPRIKSQDSMHTNIDFVVDQLGIIGFLEALITKPDQDDDTVETDDQYQGRLERLLVQAKKNLADGIKDGIIVGYKDDHQFKFNSFGKDYKHVNELFKNNELQIATSLKQDASLWGRDYGTSETQITVVFTKMLSELRSIQNILKANMEFAYTLELTLAGFKFDYLSVEFKHSTIQDDLKYQQAQEIKIRNVRDKYILGSIDADQMADELGYETKASEPRVPAEILAGGTMQTDKSAADATKEKKKDASDKKTRKKNKVLPKDK